MSSTMALVKVDRGDSSLLHDQVAAQIRRAIADGEAGPGERLPPARDLAAVLGVDTKTVLRALRMLRGERPLAVPRGPGGPLPRNPGGGGPRAPPQGRGGLSGRPGAPPGER